MGGRGSAGARGSGGGEKLLNRIESTSKNPLPIVPDDLKETAIKYWSRQSWDKKKNAEVEEVDMKNVKAWQSYIRPETMKAIALQDKTYQASSDFPRGLKIGDTVLVMDGNHRTAVEYLRGSKTIKMRVLEYKPRGKR